MPKIGARCRAEFESRCYWCGEPIHVGDEIEHGYLGTGWCHWPDCIGDLYYRVESAKLPRNDAKPT